MNDNMQCPSCKEKIDDDFLYCDQCGQQILVCSVCGRPGKGKRCVLDGKELIPAGSGASAASKTESIPAPPAQPVQPVQPVQPTLTPQPVQPTPSPPPAQPAQAAPIIAPVQPPQQISGDKVKLTSQMHGITIEAKDGDIIGRKNGAFTGVFARFNFISGTHCKFVKNAAGWHIQDMGSTNGTFYNGGQLAPNALYPVLSNSTIKIADIELLLTYDTNEGGTARL
ncbi:MAG: FHA domain-containing protein [Treponema sp.]|nr:FHA domain-containing protein [Treponema sp.]